MKNFEVKALVDGWTGQAATLHEAIAMRDEILIDNPDEEVKIVAEVDESDAQLNIKTFEDAEVGDYAYVWENNHKDWGEYRFETTDPWSVDEAQELFKFDPEAVITRRLWKLIEETEIRADV